MMADIVERLRDTRTPGRMVMERNALEAAGIIEKHRAAIEVTDAMVAAGRKMLFSLTAINIDREVAEAVIRAALKAMDRA